MLEGWHLFQPNGINADDEKFNVHVVIRQNMFFGPFPESYLSIADAEAIEILTMIVGSAQQMMPLSTVLSDVMDPNDRDFLCGIMKLDPRDRPLAKEILQNPWFNGI